ncbi:hypothetical protein FEM48_Zijuj12G0047100 [Ziziphus jujuba var. spinosa]|uniref:Uncharacterized protein n=1 Tax=Ziziphus jujuba var. spinosa TaxID=714518 RepID=A0A978UB85_ZIZJJ|nr:hypothetical protein FEM48_Zijuj12G0047100 [Ziziphus jujuba var. spinosa]
MFLIDYAWELWMYCWSTMQQMNNDPGPLFVLDIRNWIRNIEHHAPSNVNKILVGNKVDLDESKRAVQKPKGQALANEYGIKFFETV